MNFAKNFGHTMKFLNLLLALFFTFFFFELPAQNLDYLGHIHLGDGAGLNDEAYIIRPYNNGDILTSGRF
ncbi:hypothetical protein, partial [Arthrospira sp. PCC 8006]|uniref:hypothetical protein n=1 Tax=Arthrospira sp. PCC 8006 TaxID=1982224 RepID=UPI00396F4471